MKRAMLKSEKADFAAKFISARGKRKALALREMDLLSELDNNHILYFHDAFEKKNIVVLITELYPLITTLQLLLLSCVWREHIDVFHFTYSDASEPFLIPSKIKVCLNNSVKVGNH